MCCQELTGVASGVQAEHFAKLLKWLEHINETRQLKTQLDLDRLALGGHSRGGSLACHVYLQTPSLIKAVYLLDPVDDDADGAIEKLGKLREKPRLGITGVGVTSGFNPRSRNFWVSAKLQPASVHARTDSACHSNDLQMTQAVSDEQLCF